MLEDKNATTLKQAILSTAGVTLGTGEGGNAFGDRFFIRGFDARNDIFIDGVRDPGVSVRENFFTEQVEILRGPGSIFRRPRHRRRRDQHRHQAGDDGEELLQHGHHVWHRQDQAGDARRQPGDQPDLAVRAGGMFQDAGVAGRDYVKDDRDGAFVATTWKPIDAVKITGELHPYRADRPSGFRRAVLSAGHVRCTAAGGPFPDFGANRNNCYGFVNRDFFRTGQDIGTLNAEVQITPDLMLSNKFRDSRSDANYIGTLPEAPMLPLTPLSASTLSANPQSRYQVTNVIANQTEATYKFSDGAASGTRLSPVSNIDDERSSSTSMPD